MPLAVRLLGGGVVPVGLDRAALFIDVELLDDTDGDIVGLVYFERLRYRDQIVLRLFVLAVLPILFLLILLLCLFLLARRASASRSLFHPAFARLLCRLRRRFILLLISHIYLPPWLTALIIEPASIQTVVTSLYCLLFFLFVAAAGVAAALCFALAGDGGSLHLVRQL